jgi:hypothetical protein
MTRSASWVESRTVVATAAGWRGSSSATSKTGDAHQGLVADERPVGRKMVEVWVDGWASRHRATGAPGRVLAGGGGGRESNPPGGGHPPQQF